MISEVVNKVAVSEAVRLITSFLLTRKTCTFVVFSFEQVLWGPAQLGSSCRRRSGGSIPLGSIGERSPRMNIEMNIYIK